MWGGAGRVVILHEVRKVGNDGFFFFFESFSVLSGCGFSVLLLFFFCGKKAGNALSHLAIRPPGNTVLSAALLQDRDIDRAASETDETRARPEQA